MFLKTLLGLFRQRRMDIEKNKDYVIILKEGNERTLAVARHTMDKVSHAMKIDYF